MSVLTDKPSRTTQTRRKHARDRRTRVLKEGGRRVELLLEADAAAALDALQKATGATATAVICGLLLTAKARKR